MNRKSPGYRTSVDLFKIVIDRAVTKQPTKQHIDPIDTCFVRMPDRRLPNETSRVRNELNHLGENSTVNQLLAELFSPCLWLDLETNCENEIVSSPALAAKST